MPTTNLQLWESVQKTDPAYTKKYTGAGGFTGTSINPTYLHRKATEQFGPVGTGWGYTVLEERFDEGAPLNLGVEGQPLVMGKIHTIKLAVWYEVDGKRGEVIHYGHTPYVFRTRHGIQTDPEAPKKSLTDALSKALSVLGFGADIHMGLYDDFNYVEQVAQEVEIETAVNQVEVKERQKAEAQAWLDENIRLMNESVNLNMLAGVFKSALRKLEAKRDTAGIKRLTLAKDRKKAELEGQEAA
ncbi:hypothetical protein [Hahella sp. NBU794]|uniref:hypothetical protein n=1 Tax=Hahella sp. NBU794 TaxID=3422590 RepID=UPI003D6F848B